MKKKRILFRADGNTVAGYGHIIRALSLAAILRKKYEIVFVLQETDAFLKTQIKNGSDQLIEIPVTTHLVDEAKMLCEKFIQKEDIVVLDGYGYNLTYQKEIKKHCFKLMCIDDIHDREFVADVIINHSEGLKPKNYKSGPFSKLYLGTRYAILRGSFLAKHKPTLFEKTHRAFVNMGGTDQQNFTQRALNVCLKNKSIGSIDVVVGSFYAHREKLNALILKYKNVRIKIHSNLSEKEIYTLMKKSTVAICSASTISYEYASVGGFLFVYQTVLNQKNIYKFLIQSKVAFPFSSFDKQLKVLSNKKKATEYFKNRNTYFSGNSKTNLAAIFEDLEKERNLELRLAKENDVMTYYHWANDPDVRKNAVHSESIPLDNHKKWFASKLKSGSSALYIFEINGIALGQVRLVEEKGKAVIDYSVDKKFRGKGYGSIILKKAIEAYWLRHPAHQIVAKAKSTNLASNRVFENLGFKNKPTSTTRGVTYCSYALLPAKN